jgi:hypothetical protein
MGNPKGNGGELQVAKILHGWWSAFEPTTPDGKPVRFVRTPLSGGWVYGPGFDVCADLITNAPRFPFSVEVKRVERWSMDTLIDCKPSPVWAFWRQCQRDADRTAREPMLWFRKSRKPWLVMLRRGYVTALKMGAPDIHFPTKLDRMVDCGSIPVIYLADSFLAHSPQLFARSGT